MGFFRTFPAFLCFLALLPINEAFAKSKKPAASTQKTSKPKPKPKSKSSPVKSTAPKPKVVPVAKQEDDDDELSLAARGAIVIDAWTGKALYEKNADSRFYPASTTKIMTALLVIEGGCLDNEVEITIEDARVGESSLSIRPGERFSRRQMLYGLMLKSANDVAHALGRDNSGTMEAFAARMTQRARELGCTNTNFTNPHGLHDSRHYTTPRDLALIARAAMSQPLFRQIVATRQAPWETLRGTIPLTNHNRLLEKYPGCIGVKTGYTIPAQQVLASAANKNGREAISIVMHTDKPGIWEDSAKLLDFGLKPR